MSNGASSPSPAERDNEETEPTRVLGAVAPDTEPPAASNQPAPADRPGRRRAAEAAKGPSPVLVLVGMGLGALIALGAWAALVWWAVDLGQEARDDGSAGDWALMIAVALLAALFLGALLWLVAQLLHLVGWSSRPRSSQASADTPGDPR